MVTILMVIILLLLIAKKALGKFLNFGYARCYREANKCANALARRGSLPAQDFSIFIQPHNDVTLLLSLDFVGTLHDRFVLSSLEAL